METQSSPLDFDDLESEAAPPSEPVETEEEATETPAEEGDADTEEAETEEADGDEEAEEDPEAAKAAAEAAKKLKPGKSYKLKTADGKTIDVAGDVKLQVPVNGKMETVALQEVLNDYAGRVDYNRKYQELDVEKKSVAKEKTEFTRDRDELNGSIKQLTELANAGDVRGVSDLINGVLGTDLDAGWKKLHDAFLDRFQKLAEMTDEQRENFELKEHNDRLNKKIEADKQKAAKHGDSETVTQRVNAVLEKSKMSKQQYAKLHDDMIKTGKIKAEEITPELIGLYHEAVAQSDGIEEVLAEIEKTVQLKFSKEVVFKSLQEEWTKNPELTKEDITDIAREVYGKDPVKTINTRVKKHGAPKSGDKPITKKKEIISFDDLD